MFQLSQQSLFVHVVFCMPQVHMCIKTKQASYLDFLSRCGEFHYVCYHKMCSVMLWDFGWFVPLHVTFMCQVHIYHYHHHRKRKLWHTLALSCWLKCRWKEKKCKMSQDQQKHFLSRLCTTCRSDETVLIQSFGPHIAGRNATKAPCLFIAAILHSASLEIDGDTHSERLLVARRLAAYILLHLEHQAQWHKHNQFMLLLILFLIFSYLGFPSMFFV